MKPEKRLFAFSILYLFDVRRPGRRPLAAGMSRSARRRDPPPPAGRALIMGLLLAAFAVLVYAITIAKMSAVMTH